MGRVEGVLDYVCDTFTKVKYVRNNYFSNIYYASFYILPFGFTTRPNYSYILILKYCNNSSKYFLLNFSFGEF